MALTHEYFIRSPLASIHHHADINILHVHHISKYFLFPSFGVIVLREMSFIFVMSIVHYHG